jgi:hypothetical protein
VSTILELSFEDWSHAAYLESVDMEDMDGKRLPNNLGIGYADHVGKYPFIMMLDFRGCDVLMKSSNLQPTYFQYYAFLLLVEPRRSLMYLPNAAAGWMMKLLLASGKAQLCLRC